MFNVRPDKRRFGFYVEPPEGPPGFRLNADGSVSGTLPGDASTAFLGYDLGASAAIPGGTTVTVRPEQDVPGLHNFRPPEEPGLHNFRPPEEAVPGFRINADGSIRDDAAPAGWRDPDVGGNPFGVFDRRRLNASAFMPFGDGSPPPYLALARRLYNGLSGPPTLASNAGQPAGVAPSALASSALPLSTPTFFSGNGAGGVSINTRPLPLPFGRLDSGNAPLSFAEPLSGRGLSTPEADVTNAAVTGTGLASDGQRPESDHVVDPNIVRVSAGDDEVQIAQQQEPPRSKLRKDPSPGVPVVLPNGSTIAHPESPTGKLMAPTADLSEVAAAGRKVGKQYLQMLKSGHPLAIVYLGVAMESYLGHGGTFDYQRRGNWFTGYTHLQQFEAVSNLNVGLFGQQAGLTLDELLTIAGKFACNRSSNAKPDQPYCLDPKQLEYMTRGYKIGQSGVFDPPSPR